MMWLLFVLLGAAAGFIFAPRYISGVDPKIAAGGGAFLGLIVGWFLKPLIWIAVLGLIGAAAYWYYDNYMRKS